MPRNQNDTPPDSIDSPRDRQKAEISKVEKQIKATSRELKLRLDFLNQLARKQSDELAQLRTQSPSPARDKRIKRIEHNLGFYRSICRAAAGAERMQAGWTQPLDPAKLGTKPLHPKVQDVFAMKLVEAQTAVVKAQMLVEDLAPKMKIVGGALGLPSNYTPDELKWINKIKARIKSSPAVLSRLQLIHQKFGVAAEAAATAARQVEQVESLEGRDALNFLTGTLKVPQLAGKIYPLERLHQEFASDPDLSHLFPKPTETEIPQEELLAAQQQQKAEQERPRGLLSFLGLKRK